MTTPTGIMDLNGSGKDLADLYEIRASGPTGTTHYLSTTYGKDLGSIFYMNTNLGGLGLTGTVGTNCGHKTINGTDIGSMFCLKGTVTNSYYLISDGNLTGWTNNGITTSASIGNPPPSIQSTVSNKYAYINAADIIPGLTTFYGRTIKFDIYTTSSNLVNFFFACSGSGQGNMFRLEGRSSPNYSGLTSTISWLNWSYPTNGPGNLPPSTWYTIVITINSSGVATYTYNGTSFSGSYTISNSGTYIGVHTDGLGGGYVDNIYIR